MRNTSEEHRETAEVRRAGLAGLVVNTVLAALKGVIGVLTCSSALTADAVHSLSDLSTDIAVVIGARYWSRPADENHPLGHRGIETTVSLFIGLMLIAAGAGIGIEAVRSMGRALPVQSPGLVAAAAALVSLVVKWVLTSWTMKKSRATGSVALAANAVHHRSDALSSVPVLVALILTGVDPRLAFLDPLAGAVVSVFVIVSGIRVLKPGYMELTGTAPPPEVIDDIRKTALSVQGVAGVHSIRARRQAGGVFVDLHVQVPGEFTVGRGYLLCREVERAVLRSEPSVRDVIARIEPSVPCGDADKCYRSEL